MTIYRAELINTSGCVFDTSVFTSLKACHQFAANRNGCILKINKLIGADMLPFKSFKKR